jgi:hypothetical protein
MFLSWFSAFLFTQIFECPIYLFAQKRSPRLVGRRLAVAFGASALTHPVVWFVIPRLVYDAIDPFEHPNATYAVMVVVAEAFAVAAEALYLQALALKAPWRWALVANATSCLLGFLCRWLFGFP